MAVLWAMASWHRLRVIDQTVIGSDSLGPYLQAQGALFGYLPRPPNPESGDALWISMLPLVAATDSLVDMFSLRFIAGGFIAPIGFLAAYHWTNPMASAKRRWAAAIAAGLFLAFDPGLLDTLVSGARSYGAPELVGMVTLCAALTMRQTPWAPAAMLVFLVAAAGHHPLALGVGLGLLPLFPIFHRSVGMKRLKWALVFGALACIPRILRGASLALCGDGPMACLSQVATSNVVAPEPWTSLVRTAFHDRYMVDLGASAWLLMAGLVAIFACRYTDHRKSAHMAIGATLGVLLIGLWIGYVRSYHLRIVSVPVAVAAALGMARAWPVAIIACGVFVWRTHALLPVGPDPGAVARQDKISTQLPTVPIWVDQVWWSGVPHLDASAVVLSGWLRGQKNYELHPGVSFILLENSSDEPGWNVREFPNAKAARLWFDQQEQLPHQRGGAYDWATISNPNTKLEDARW